MSQETELKLLLADIDERDRLARALGNRVARVEQANMYFDTDDDALSRHRWALRIRRENERTVMTLKGKGSAEGDLMVRAELDRELPDASWVAAIRGDLDVAGEVRQLLRDTGRTLPDDIDLAKLEKLGTVSNVRSVYSLPGTPLMVELDETEYPDFSVRYEVELEIPEGEEREPGVEALRRVFDLIDLEWRPSMESKYARFRAILADM